MCLSGVLLKDIVGWSTPLIIANICNTFLLDQKKIVFLITNIYLLVFPIVMYRCASWTIKKAKHQRIDAFELESPLDSRKIKPVNPKGN